MERLENLVAGIGRWLRSKYQSIRLGRLMPFYSSKAVSIPCPHDIRIPMEQLSDISSYRRKLLETAMIDSMRPDGCTLKVCRRCYSLCATRVPQTFVGF